METWKHDDHNNKHEPHTHSSSSPSLLQSEPEAETSRNEQEIIQETGVFYTEFGSSAGAVIQKWSTSSQSGNLTADRLNMLIINKKKPLCFFLSFKIKFPGKSMWIFGKNITENKNFCQRQKVLPNILLLMWCLCVIRQFEPRISC